MALAPITDQERAERKQRIAGNKRLNIEEIKREAPVLESRPTHAVLSLTGRCNLDCAHCGIRKGRRIPLSAADISDEVFDKIDRDLLPYVSRVTLGGGNDAEQMFARKWDYYFGRMCKYDFELTLQTNGTLYNDDRCRQLAERGVIIRLSIDAATDETFRMIRGASVERLYDFVRNTLAYSKAMGRNDTQVHFSATLCESNIRELPLLVEKGKELGVERVTAHHLRPHYEHQRYQSLVYHKSLTNDCIAQAIEKARELGQPVDFPEPFEIPAMTVEPPEDFDESSSGGCQIKTFKCFWPWTTLVIDERGVVTPCGSSTQIMGDLRKQDFMEAWNSKKYQAFRKQVNSEKPETDCRTCLLGRRQVSDSSMLALIGGMKGFDVDRMLRNYVRDWLLSKKNGEKWLYRVRKLAGRV